MNKLVKGSIAGAAGVALLLGGAGTFALWNDSADVDAGVIQTGTMRIVTTPSTTPAWADASADADSTSFDPATDLIVPGDTVTLTQSVDVTANGKNLLAQLSYLTDSIEIQDELEDLVTVGLTATKITGPATIASSGTNTYLITPDDSGDTTTFSVVITITFDADGVEGQDSVEGIDLSEAAFSLVQVRP